MPLGGISYDWAKTTDRDFERMDDRRTPAPPKYRDCPECGARVLTSSIRLIHAEPPLIGCGYCEDRLNGREADPFADDQTPEGERG